MTPHQRRIVYSEDKKKGPDDASLPHPNDAPHTSAQALAVELFRQKRWSRRVTKWGNTPPYLTAQVHLEVRILLGLERLDIVSALVTPAHVNSVMPSW